ncbi:PHP domain-containing protein [Sporolactobacillus pectinivorans]|uniref:PHP domain-containing protein n=1 Tax=Sporolactobacillus pectinivorans TaxID=1591408 RepID=UPI000C25B15C|nr:PHP domain-containing protein [Sporolactobacillus pectinivorans]
MTIDLHCHTNVSDNSFSIEEVLHIAKRNHVDHLAITDHDTTIGLHQAMNLGKSKDLDIIPGIEISAYDFLRDRRAHILGLYIKPGHPALEELCQPLREARQNASQEMVEKLIQAGYEIEWDEVSKLAEAGTGVFKQHIMHVLIKKGYTNSIYGDLYKKIFSRGEPKGVAFVPIRYLEAIDAIQAIREAGGVPVLAHPGQFDNFPAVPDWVRAGLEGIEVHHPLNNEQAEKKAQDLAGKYHLIQTGGSDFHGFYTDTGSVPGSRITEPAWFEAVKLRRDLVRVTEWGS